MKKRLLCLALALILVLTATPTLASEGRFEEGDDDLYRFPGDSLTETAAGDASAHPRPACQIWMEIERAGAELRSRPVKEVSI